jgi:hypothetical protein
MAIYKLFPTKDATIYSRYPVRNTGLDEMLDVSIEDATNSGLPQASRYLIHFSQTEINDILTNKVNGASWSASLSNYLAYGDGLNIDTTLEFYPISGSWVMGTGKFSYSPEYTNGVSWIFRGVSGSDAWTTSSFDPFVTASYNSDISASKGGGTWYTGSSNVNIVPMVTASQTFSYFDDFDINVNVTNIVKAWTSSLIENNGIIVKQKDEFIDNPNYNITLRYFSRDTHTIYPPILDLKWRDYTWNTGSSTQTILNVLPVFVDVNENPGIFYPESINRFRINARPEYPDRIYQTASLYTTNYYLPTSSCYAIKDLDTNEFVINFDEQFTQLSADSNSSYFDLYMSGLQPERYYTILIKTIIDNSTLIFDNNYSFKVING